MLVHQSGIPLKRLFHVALDFNVASHLSPPEIVRETAVRVRRFMGEVRCGNQSSREFLSDFPGICQEDAHKGKNSPGGAGRAAIA
jgi:hypothetical protein